jgi:hypothetical protein
MHLFVIILTLTLTACVTKPPRDVDNICSIFNQYPKWERDTKDVEHRWHVSVPVQMAIIHQESKFNGNAYPPRTKLLKIIPWRRPSSAYGYSQALQSTWLLYKRGDGGAFASRNNFGDAVDFIGWYANQANRQAGIPRTDVYDLYLAYHEGIGGFIRQTYLNKSWLMQVAKKVKLRSQIYETQLKRCGKLL